MDWSLDGARARLDSRTGAFSAEYVRMASNVSFLDLPNRGRRQAVRVASAGLLAGLLTGSVAAAPPAEPGAKSPPAAQKEVRFWASHVETTKDSKGNDVYLLTDDVLVRHVDPKDPTKQMELRADRVELTDDKANPVAVATGSPKVTDERSRVVGEKITVWIKTRQARVEGKKARFRS
jgi:hypothetical protein